MNYAWLIMLTLVACKQDTSEWRSTGSSKPTTTESTEAKSVDIAPEDLPRYRTQCIDMIAQVSRAVRAGGPTAEHPLAREMIESCAPFCASTAPDATRSGMCKGTVVVLRDACAAKAEDCARLCADTGMHPYVRNTACEIASAPKSSSTHQAAELTSTLRIGDKVSAQWTNGRWYPGTLTAVYSDGTADVRFDDGDRSKGLAFSKIKLVKRPLFEADVSRPVVKKKQGLVEGASCAGPGWQYVCGGRCTDVQRDSANCGKCGNRCDSGYSCDGGGTCRDANGNL